MSAVTTLTKATDAYIAMGNLGPDEVQFAIQQLRRIVAAAHHMNRDNQLQTLGVLADLADDVVMLEA